MAGRPPLPLRALRAAIVFALITSVVASGCGEYDPADEGSPSTRIGSTKAALEGPPVPVGPFLNGALPTRTPRDLSTTTWQVIDAFPALSFNQTLVIEPNPSNDRIYVGSRDGNIFSFENMPNVNSAEPFLDLRDRTAVVWDGGFLGLVFHPEFGVPGSPFRNYVYVYYSSHCPLDAARDAVDLSRCYTNYPMGSTGGFFNTYLRLSRFEVPDGELAADPASERVMINLRLYNGSHRGGGMVFDDDGYLIVTIGDQFRYVTAQDIANNLEGGVMRLAVDITDNGDGSWSCPPGSHQPVRTVDTAIADGAPMNITDEVSGLDYCIPDDNPWVDPTGSVFGEYCSLGHRNPHRLAKDFVTGRMWSGEVGESSREEINIIACGNNYGWPFREGLIAGPRAQPSSYIGTLTDPVIDFTRTEANAIIGGYVYRGSKFPELYGKYLVGDYVTSNLWAVTLDENTQTVTKKFLTTFTPGGLATWGQDNDGEVYLGDVYGTNSLYTLDRIGEPIPDPPALLSQTGAFQDLATLEPSAFWVPYGLNQPFWSDSALKWRWIALPNDGNRDSAAEQIGYSAMGNWTYPTGTVLMKHFELAVDENDPSITIPLETRLLAKGDDGAWYGVTYRWRTDQSDADLLTRGESGDYTIQLKDGGTYDQSWYFPSRDDCTRCHIPAAGGALGPRSHQLNGDLTYPSTGLSGNQLITWNQLGMFSPPLDEAAVPGLLRSVSYNDVTAPLEDRARSWLDSNCSSCHRPGGANAGFDARLTTPFENQGLVFGGVRDDLGYPGMTILTPGDPTLSAIYQRSAAVGPVAMPPLAKALVETPAVDILGEWILRVDPSVGQNGVVYDYYETAALSALPNFGTLTPKATGTSSGFDIGVRQRNDDFAFRFHSLLYVDTSGSYTFFTSSDDGSRLYVDGALIVDNDGLHAAQERSGTINVNQGYHTIEVTMFERGGSESLVVNWQGPDTGGLKEPIGAGRLFLQEPSANNDPPSLTDPVSFEDRVGTSVSRTLQGTDPNGDLLYFDAAGLPNGLSIDHTTGEISGSVSTDALGTHIVTASASDANEVSVVSFPWAIIQGGSGAYCGDGNLDAGEACDDGNFINGDGCTTGCVIEFCGDGVVNNNGAEACDPPGTALCDGFCMFRISLCGDGFLTPPEQCEDGNVLDGDGCSAACMLEQSATCGDGVVDAGEQCDDGNLADGDGCASDCSYENGADLTQVGTIIARITTPIGG
ncbi:MAG: PQQ-dependent sugar dehydrogenase, partial [Polyangiales bacterium]